MAQLALNDAERQALLEAYPAVFVKSFWQRYGLAVGAGVVAVYLVFCFFFFADGKRILLRIRRYPGEFLCSARSVGGSFTAC